MISFAVALAALAADMEVSTFNDGFSTEVIQDAYDRFTPAICLVAYSSEITNANTGEVSRRNHRTIGLIVDSDGLVMAHGHMVLPNRRPYNIKVTVGEGDEQQEYDGALLGKPDDLNVVFLKIESDAKRRFPNIVFETDNRLELGAPIMTIGILSRALDYTRGLQTRRVGAVIDEPRTTYCLDRAISFGYVGGPVIDTRGRAVGVLGFDLSAEEGGDLYTRNGHPLIYQAALFHRYIDNPPSDDADSDAAWLGIFTQPLTDDLADYWDLPPEGGIVVSTVVPGSPADTVGLEPGDVVVEFNGRPVTTKQDHEVLGFTKMVRESPVGESLPVTVLRDGVRTKMELTLRTRPRTAQRAQEYEDSILGLTVRELTTDVRIGLNLKPDVQGVIVRRVRPGSPANQARIRPRYVILGIGDEQVTSLSDYVRIVESLAESKPEEVTLFCRVGANTAFFRLQPRWDDGS